MRRKIFGTILLIAALTLLAYNLFFRGGSEKEKITPDTNNEKVQSLQESQKSKEDNLPIEPIQPETKKSDIAKKMGKDIDKFNTANSVIYEFMEHINNGSTEEAYKMLNEDFKKELGLPYEAFKQKYSFTTEKAFKGENLLSSEMGIIVSGYLIDYYGGDSVDIENSYMPYCFTVYDTDPHTIADIGIKSIAMIEKTVNITEKVHMKIYQVFNTTDGIIIYATIENKGAQTFELNAGNYGFYAVNDIHTYPHKLLNSIFTDYELQPDEIKHYRILFPGANKIQSIGATFQSGEKINLGGITQ